MAATVRKRVLKWAAWLLAGTLAVPIVAYGALLLINWRDQPPSEAALLLAENYRNRPAVADADNAYVYAMGFDVAPDADPRDAGLRRIEWIRTLPPEAQYPLSGDPATPYEAHRSSRSVHIQKIAKSCRTGTRDCAAALESNDDELRAWLQSEQWLLDRYLVLLRHPGWLETLPFDGRVVAPNYTGTTDGQKLLITKAYLLASQDDAAAVRELLGEDVRYWRRVLASSDTIITKMVATVALYRTFTMGNLVLRRLPADLQLAARPAEWTAPLSDDERSMLRCLTGEWIAARLMLDHALSQPDQSWFGDMDWESAETLLLKMAGHATEPLFKMQHYQNAQAEMYLQATAALDVPIERFPAALEQARAIFDYRGWSENPLANLYNPTGRIFISIAAGAHLDYPPRVADIEGVRRAAVLTTELRAQGVASENIPAALASSQIRSPYTGEPFTWDAEESAIVFVGMEPGERGRHALMY